MVARNVRLLIMSGKMDTVTHFWGREYFVRFDPDAYKHVITQVLREKERERDRMIAAGLRGSFRTKMTKYFWNHDVRAIKK